MCAICGCSDATHTTVSDPETGEIIPVHAGSDNHNHAHERGHAHAHEGGHDHADDRHHHQPHGHEDDLHHDHDDHPAHAHGTLLLQEKILAKNDRLAERNRGWFEGRNILALNLVSAPGSGKTTLLERTLRDLQGELPIQVIEGDQASMNDAERIRATGCKVVQINTGAGCHLEADMLARGLQQLAPAPNSIVMIENVGNLVCPALFDLGERAKVVILSITEGEDKPIKYPHMFRAAQIMILNKIDLLPYVDFDVARCLAYAHAINPALRVLKLSAKTGEGLDAWYGWLRAQVKATGCEIPSLVLPRTNV